MRVRPRVVSLSPSLAAAAASGPGPRTRTRLVVLEAGPDTDWVVNAALPTAGAGDTGAKPVGTMLAGGTEATEVVVMGIEATCIPDGTAAGTMPEGMNMLLGAVTAAGIATCAANTGAC